MKLILLIFKNLRRNLLRSALTVVGTMMLVCVVTLVWSILALLNLVTEEKRENLRALVTDRWSIPSRMPISYADPLSRGAARNPGDVLPLDSMTWQFYVGTVDREKLTRESFVAAIACQPEKLATMMEGLDNLSPLDAAELQENIEKLKKNRQGIILGRNQIKGINKRVGERFKTFGLGGFKDLDLEFEIVGLFPAGRYDGLGAINRDYYNGELDRFPLTHAGRKHPMAERSLSLVWLRVADMEKFTRLAAQVESSPYFTTPPVKCETAASGMSTFLEAFRDLIWGMRYLLAPACVLTLSLVIANAISISVRERRLEFAVLKVLGFRPGHILFLVLGESLLLGVGAGLASAGLTYMVINWGYGGLSFPIGFFDRFLIPLDALWWGSAVGGLASLVGSFLPAWAARNVKVADVFAKVG
jgi:putative ABC transport system permease protein